MCGRLFQTLPLSRLLRIARTKNVKGSEFHTQSFNVCPTTYIPVIKRSKLYGADEAERKQDEKQILEKKMEQAIKEDGTEPVNQQNTEQDKKDRELQFMRWGQKTNFSMIINGRIEEMSGKRTFAKIIENRCVVIMEGYYQWKAKDEPFSFKPKNSDHFMVAALYSEENEIIILTKDATPELSKVHERMPVILSPSEVELWLDPKNTKHINLIIQRCLTNKDKAIWKNVKLAKLAPYVSKKQQKSIKCLMTIEEYKKELDSKGLMSFWKKKVPVQSVGKDGQTIKQKSEAKSIEPAAIQKKDFPVKEAVEEAKVNSSQQK